MGPELLVLTVLLSAAAAGFSTYFLNVSKETRGFWARKGEELYVRVEALDHELSKHFENGLALVGSAPQASDHEGLQRAGEHLTAVKMLTGFYFPAFSPALARVIAAAGTAQRTLDTARKSQSDRERLLGVADSAVCEFKDALEDMKAVILRDRGLANTKKSFAAFFQPSKSAVGARRALQVGA